MNSAELVALPVDAGYTPIFRNETMIQEPKKTHTFDEVLAASLVYFNGDELAANVFAEKYALFNPKTELYDELTPLDMHKRMAKEFARIEANYPNGLKEEKILNYLSSWEIIPQGSPMAGIGNPYQLMSLSNCFVVNSPSDSFGGIHRTDQEEAQIMKRRGGVGFDISTIRPKGFTTANAAKTTDGIAVFMEQFSDTCRRVAQGGRRGALMLTISVHHPEIRTFIQIKRDRKKVTGANVSIRISDEFMRAVESKGKVELRFPVEGGKVYEEVDAAELWNEIMASAHESAEPGVLFWDTVKKNTPSDIYADDGFESISTNPCGEIVLSGGGDACRLLLVNALKFVKYPFTKKAEFDYERFRDTCRVSQRLMDDIVDLEIECNDKIVAKINADPEDEFTKAIELKLWENIKRKGQLGRRTGLGLTAIGDTLASLGVCYGKPEAIEVVRLIYKTLALGSYEGSIELAKERGAFPIYSYEKEKDHPFITKIIGELPRKYQLMYRKFGRRNIANTTTAPAGSVSIVAQTSSGIEPVYLVEYDRWKKINPGDPDTRVDRVDEKGDAWQKFHVYHHGFKKWMDVTGKKKFEDSPYAGATSNEIDWVNKVRCQAAAQEWICHSISNTTNVPADTSVEVVKAIYMEGWKSGCKGITIYRDGCRDGVLTSDKSSRNGKFEPRNAIKRPDELDCEVHRVKIKGEDWTIFVGLLNDHPYEVMGGLSKYVSLPKKVKTGKIVKIKRGTASLYNFASGTGEDIIEVKDLTNIFENPTYGSFTRTLSLALRHGASAQFVVEQLQKGDKESDMFTFSKAISRVLKTKIVDGTKANSICVECKSTALEYREGCVTCMSCGHSKCG